MSAVTPPELLCINCGYDLRGLDRTGNCPECGRRVVGSVRARRLMGADYRWLTRITVGQWLVSRGLNGLSLSLFFSFAGLLLMIPLSISPLAFLIVLAFLLVVFIASVSILGLIAGVWIVTGKEPPASRPESPWSHRRLVRVFLLVAIASFIGVFCSASGWGNVAFVAYWVLVLTCVASASAAMVSMLRWLESFAIRMPCTTLASQTRIIAFTFMWLPVGVTLLCVLPLAIATGNTSKGMSALLGLGMSLGVFLGIGLLIQFGLMTSLMGTYLRLLRTCRLRANRRAAKEGSLQAGDMAS